MEDNHNECRRITLVECVNISEVFHIFPKLERIAIDMIIGIPEATRKGGRLAEKQARALLSPRGSVVFSAPCRDAVYAQDYVEALRRSRASSPEQIGLSKQSYNIAPKIKEIDIFLRANPTRQSIVIETHPELAFWEMNGRTTLPSKHSPEGKFLRTKLLKCEHVYTSGALTKDQIDALACLWSAIRHTHKRSDRIPLEAPRDRYNLPMQITW
jgi:predicted RNase H-like nuclease